MGSAPADPTQAVPGGAQTAHPGFPRPYRADAVPGGQGAGEARPEAAALRGDAELALDGGADPGHEGLEQRGQGGRQVHCHARHRPCALPGVGTRSVTPLSPPPSSVTPLCPSATFTARPCACLRGHQCPLCPPSPPPRSVPVGGAIRDTPHVPPWGQGPLSVPLSLLALLHSCPVPPISASPQPLTRPENGDPPMLPRLPPPIVAVPSLCPQTPLCPTDPHLSLSSPLMRFQGSFTWMYWLPWREMLSTHLSASRMLGGHRWV